MAQVVPEKVEPRGSNEEEEEVEGPRTSAERREKEKHDMKARLKSAHVAQLEDTPELDVAQKENIHTIKVLGEGAFGIVDLVVVDSPKGNLLCVRKKLLKRSEKNNNDPELEVEFMEMCRGCNFIVQLWSHVVGLYDYTLLLEYCPYNTMQHLLNEVCDVRSRNKNGCLAFISDTILKLNRWAGLTEREVRFYTACVTLGLEQMHSKGVLHRDLKPANCFISDKRYLKVADLGLCKKLGEDGKAYSKAGTPGYMAPEVYYSQGKASGGYSYPCDIWSLALMVWEMAEGLLPRWAVASWYWTSIHFPDHFSPELRSLLTGMLHKAPRDRTTIAQIKAHPWFDGFDWELLASGKMVAPDPLEIEAIHIHSRLMPEHLG